MRDLSFFLRLHALAPLARFNRTALPLRPFKNIISARSVSGETFINDDAPCFKRFRISDFDYDEILCFLGLACPLPPLFESLDEKFETNQIPRPFRHDRSLRYRTPVWRIVLREQNQKLDFQTRSGCFKGSALEFFAYKRRKLREKNGMDIIEWAIILIYALLFIYSNQLLKAIQESSPLFIAIVAVLMFLGLFLMVLLKDFGCFRPVSSRIVNWWLRRSSHA